MTFKDLIFTVGCIAALGGFIYLVDLSLEDSKHKAQESLDARKTQEPASFSSAPISPSSTDSIPTPAASDDIYGLNGLSDNELHDLCIHGTVTVNHTPRSQRACELWTASLPKSKRPAAQPQSLPEVTPEEPAERSAPPPVSTSSFYIDGADRSCATYGRGSVQERKCRADSAHNFHESCMEARRKFEVATGSERDALRPYKDGICEADDRFKIIN